VRWQDVLAAGLTALAEVELTRGRHAAAAEAFEEALAIRRRLAASSPDFAANRAALDRLEAKLPLPMPAGTPSGREAVARPRR
jgi:hypothetical protein